MEALNKKEEKIIKNTTSKLLDVLGVQAEFEIASQDNNEGVNIELNTQDSGMLIGYHGETLEALQLILSLCIAKRLGRFVRVSIEIGEYRKNRTDYLKRLVEQTKERVLTEKQTVTLPNLKAWERRTVHMILQDDSEVISESQGEGRDRVLTIRPK